jgi:hypothetical protein
VKEIRKFNGDFNWLSNFSPHHFRDEDGTLWRTVEHFYQAMKTADGIEQAKIWSALTPGQAKRMGQKVTMRNDWKYKNIEVMCDGVTWKFFQNKDIQKLLISTKDYKLTEGNTWHDNFWGDCECSKCKDKQGENWLGKILMMVREGFINE